MQDVNTAQRSHWGSKIGFILAAAGSAVGLGNMWKFPYITGENGGGAFVLVYLGCILLVGLPVMMAEVLLGRSSQTSAVGAFRVMNGGKTSLWMGVGWIGVIASFVILSYYSVVAGWALHYIWLSLTGTFAQGTTADLNALFGELYTNTTTNLGWHTVFIGVTIAIVLGGVQKGVERAARILMPTLFLIMLVLLAYAFTLGGAGRALSFVFAPNFDKLTGAGVLEALGHSFFTLSVGMGCMLTYGSYLSRKDDLVSASVAISLLDTGVALMACMVLFPITFTFGMEPAAGPGLVFTNMPIAFSKLPGGSVWALVFFVLLTFAALSSAISLLEVAAAYFIDEHGMNRRTASLLTGGVIFVLGIPSALSGGTELFGSSFAAVFGKNWFDSLDYLATNWLLPMGGMGIAVFAAWRVGDAARREGFTEGSTWAMKIYAGWLVLLRYVVPVGIGLVFLHAIGVI